MKSVLRPKKYISGVDFLLQKCKNKSVLHLGCTSGAYILQRIDIGDLLHMRLMKVCKELYGIDVNSGSLEILKKTLSCGNLFLGNAEYLEQVNINKTFDVILAGEFIEHLDNPGLFLKGVKRFMRKDTEFIITTPNAFSLPKFIGYAFNKYKEHPDHTASFSLYNLRNLLLRFNYKITDVYGAFIRRPINIKEVISLMLAVPFLKLLPKYSGTLIVVSKIVNN